MINPTWNQRWLCVGDSITAPVTLSIPCQWFRIVEYLASLFFTNPPAGDVPPVFIPEGVNGSQWTAIDARISAELTKWAPHGILLESGINESINGIAQAVAIPAATSVLDKFLALNLPVLMILPVCAGEIWSPANANAFDGGATGVAAYNTALKALAAGYANVTVIDGRAKWAAYEPLHNLPSPGVAAGPLTIPDAQHVHFNPTGRLQLGTWAMEGISFLR